MGGVPNQTCFEANSKLKIYQFTVEVRPDPQDPRREAKVSPKGNFFSRNNMSQHSTPEKKKRRLQHEQQFYPIAYFCQTFGDALMFWAASTV